MRTYTTYVPDRRLRLHTRRYVNTHRVICRHRVLHIRCAWRPLPYQHTEPARRVVRVTGRPHQYSALTTRPSVGRCGSGWDKDQRALQLVSYLDETAMNVAQELSDQELYNYDVLIKLLGDRFDPASRVSASRSRFHGQTRRHHEDADTYADSITELCRLGYPQSSPELRQELISVQFVRGQSDPELKKYLWVVIRTPNPH